ncbi:hypothetical protein A1O1_07512 [Capronia coronata CBS 617.96]|uniref:Uncharacterized protein n=1 Tax=Capronia coronata CBS 617.96 TaxID=1182541 RepID=W9XUK1_9EURO|nr:uncharacterized protein A1O1_07512 [Capronia coronata CBS 617.96]EXJ83883.1 hypothetical protein A1O1_07512 [Capronia coronata CBS 617.96]
MAPTWVEYVLERSNYLYPRQRISKLSRIQSDLVTAGLQYPNHCATSTPEADPATRLGIKLKFKSVSDREMKKF